MEGFDYYDTEAAHLDEISDYGGYSDFEPYSTQDKKFYCKAKSQCFEKSDIGKYVVCQTPRKNKKTASILYLVDRTRCKYWWWSHDSSFAMVFEKESAAKIQAKKYRYNNARVKQITPAMANLDYYLQEYCDV